ncbi:hypothetical protein, partial [Campylobacter sp.]
TAHIKAYESYYYNENLRQENSKKGLERAKLFSWEKCADIMITEMKRRSSISHVLIGFIKKRIINFKKL